MDDRPRKSSTQVTLVLLGAAAFLGWKWFEGRDATTTRDVYASKEDCLKDWRNADECEEAPAQRSDGARHTYWYGPSYGGGSSSIPGTQAGAPRPGTHALGTHSTTRGGFGSLGHSFGSGLS
jgi:uncharacterized protein YgiB involved in biofilm formation